jgi:hypothetical protein
MKKLILIAAIAIGILPASAQKHQTQNVIIVTLDGMRWQEPTQHLSILASPKTKRRLGKSSGLNPPKKGAS